MERHLVVLGKLQEISEKEWKVVLFNCKKYLQVKLRNKTSVGVHSEANLCMPAVDFYLSEAISKLYDGSWDWKFEKFDITNQILRIAGSLISANVDKWKNNEDKKIKIQEVEDFNQIPLSYSVGEISSDNEKLSQLTKLVEHDDECYYVVISLVEGKTYTEISNSLGCEKKKFYKIIEKLKRIIKIRDTTHE